MPIIVKVIHVQVAEIDNLILILWAIIFNIYTVSYEVCVQVFLESLVRSLNVEYSEKESYWW